MGALSSKRRTRMAGANVVVNLSASDETVGKTEYRRSLVKGQSARLLCAYIYATAGNGESTQDLVFGGQNLICENGSLLAEAPLFANETIYGVLDIQKLKGERRRISTWQQEMDGSYLKILFTFRKRKHCLPTALSRILLYREIRKREAERCNEI